MYLVRQFAEVCYGVVTYATIMNSTDLIDNISVASIIAVKGISEKQNISSKSLANKKLLLMYARFCMAYYSIMIIYGNTALL